MSLSDSIPTFVRRSFMRPVQKACHALGRWNRMKFLHVFTLISMMVAMAAFGGQGRVLHSKDPVAGEYLVSLNPAMPTETVANDIAKFYDGMLIRVWTPLNAFAIALDDPAMAEAIAADPRVALVEENGYLDVSAGATSQQTYRDPVCNDTLTDCNSTDYQTTDNRFWYLDRIDQDSPVPNGTYQYCASGAGVSVYVIDYGVQRDHWEFGSTQAEREAHVTNGYDATHPLGEPGTNGAAANPCNGFFTRDFNSFNLTHGTSVASLVNGRWSGVAKNAQVIPVRVQPCPIPLQRAEPYFVGQLVATNEANSKNILRVKKAGVTDPTAFRFPNDGTVIWEKSTAADADRGQDLWMVDGICWIKDDIGSKKAVATSSAFSIRELGTQPIDNLQCSTTGIGHEPTDAQARVKLLQRAVQDLANRIPITVSSNNLNADACETSPADRGFIKGVITVGGSMLLNNPDGELEQGTRGTNLGQKAPSGLVQRDARWVIGPGDTSQIPGTLGSNAGDCVSLFAPARNINSAFASGAFDHRDPLSGLGGSGTSFSTPIAAGVIARMLSMEDPQGYLTNNPEAVENTLVNTALENMLEPSTLEATGTDKTPNLLLRASDVMFVEQPTNMESVPFGGSTTLSVKAIASGSIASYQWYEWVEGTDRHATDHAVGPPSNTLSLNPVNRPGYYWVRVTAPNCTVGGEQVWNDSRIAHVGISYSNLHFGAGPAPKPEPDVRIITATTSRTVRLTAPVLENVAVSYRWYRGMRGDTRSPLGSDNPINDTPSSSTSYWVRMSLANDASSFIDSDAVTVGVRVVTSGQLSVEKDSFDRDRVPVGTRAVATLNTAASHVKLEWKLGSSGRPLEECTGGITCRPMINVAAETTQTLRVTDADAPTVPLGETAITSCSPLITAAELVKMTNGKLKATSGGLSYDWYEGPSRVNPGQIGAPGALPPDPPPTNGVGQFVTTTGTVPEWEPTAIGKSRDRVFWVRITSGEGAQRCYSDSPPLVVHPDNGHQGTLLPVSSFSPRLLDLPNDLVLAVPEAHPLSYFQWYCGANGAGTPITDTEDPNRQHRSWLDVGRLPEPCISSKFWVRVFTWDHSESVSSAGDACTTSITATKIIAPSTGGRYTVDVTTGCEWTAVPTAGFITIVSGAGPTVGNGRVTFDVGASSGNARNGAVIIRSKDAGGSSAFAIERSIDVRQTGSSCAVHLPTATGNYSPDASRAQLGVTSTCEWTAIVEPGSFLHLLDKDDKEVVAYSSAGNAPVTFRLDKNTSTTNQRSASISIGSAVFTVKQYPNSADLNPCPPTIKGQLFGTTRVPSKDNVVLNVETAGAGNLYQWFWTDTTHPITSATGPQLYLSPPADNQDKGYPVNPPPDSTRKYIVRVSRASCSGTAEREITVQFVNGGTCTSLIVVPKLLPEIVWSPVFGAPIELEATASTSDANVTWQWFSGFTGNATKPEGSGVVETVNSITSSTLRVSPSPLETSYWARVTSPCGTTVTGTTRIKEFVPAGLTPGGRRRAVLSQQAETKTVPAGTVTTFSVATPEVNPHFAWYEGVQGATDEPVGTDSPSLTVTAVKNTSYWCRVSADDVNPNDSETVYLEVCAPPAILVQPVSATAEVPTGTSTVTLSATVAAQALNATYTWYRGTSVENGEIVGTGPTFSKTYQSTDPVDQSVSYFCHIEDNTSTPAACRGFVNSAVITFRLTHCALTLSNWGPDYVQFTPARPATTISVGVEGQGLTYKWFRGINGQKGELPNYTGPDLTVGENTLTNGSYDAFWCEVTRPGCETPLVTPKTYAFRWGICPLPPVTVTPMRATAAISSGAAPPKFTAFIDWPRVSYQWYRGQSGDTSDPVVGATQASYQSDRVVTSVYWLRVTDLENPNCFVDSPTLVYLVGNCEPVYITKQPQSVDIPSGGTATLHADATSAFGVNYDWYEKGTPDRYRGSGSDLTVSGLTESRQYYALVSPTIADPQNCSFSTVVATIRVRSCPGITINEQPQTVSVLAPGAITTDLSVVATSSEFIFYQWYRGASGDTSDPIVGAADRTVHITQAENAEKKNYWVRMKTSSCTVDSDAAVVGCIRPHFTHVQSGNVRLGEWALMDALAEGDGLTYEWYLNAISGTPISTAKAFWIQPADTIRYFVRVKGKCGSIDSDLIVVSVCTPPIVTTQPKNAFVFPGKSATLSATVYEANDVDVAYQWFDENGSGIVGANSTTLVTPPITSEKRFSLHVTAGICAASSQEATVALCALPEVIFSGTTQNVAPQQSVTLRAGTNADSGNSFTWYRGPVGDVDNPVPVGNGGYELAVFAPLSGTAEYWAKVTHPDDHCVSRTNAYTLNVCLPRITAQPVSAPANPAQPATLSVTADLATSFQWYIGEKGDITTPVPGGTTATISVSPTADTRYWVRVIGSCGVDERGAPIGPVDSESALVTVCAPPVITSLTANASIVYGQMATLSVNATGTNLTYQWYAGASGDTTSPLDERLVEGIHSPSIHVSPQNASTYWVKVTGTCGTVNSATATVSVCATPSITAQPQSLSIFIGASTTLSVTASEATTTPMTYQWYRGLSGDSSVPVGTNPTFTTPNLTTETNYWVEVRCGICPSVASNTATVSMCVYSQSVNGAASVQTTVGQLVRLTAGQNDVSNQYLWYRGAGGDLTNPLTGWQAANYLDVAPTVTTQYWYRLQNGSCTSNSTATTVSVCVPTITTQPASVLINAGTSTTLSVVANTTGLTYRWYVGASGTTTSPIAGATGASVTVSPAANTNYWVRVTSSCGRTADSNTAVVTICQVPAISSISPVTQWIARGQTTSVNVSATGTNLTYQWYAGNSGNTASPISGGTGASIGVAPQNTSAYWVKVTGTCGTVNSATATVQVCAAPSITTHPQSVSIFSGTSTTLSVTAFEATTSPMSYQWYRGLSGDYSVPVGTNSSTFTTPNLTVDTSYWVGVSCGTCNPASSNTATVSMCAYPQSVTGAANVQTTVGQWAHLTAPQSNGNQYLWYRGASGDVSTPLTGWQVANYLDVAPTVTTSYWYRLQNGSCISNSTTTTVSVCVPTITTNPQSVTIAGGTSTTLTVAANMAVTYQWYVGASGTTTSPVAGGTAASLTVSPSSTTTYWARVTSACGRTADSAAATVTICQAPTITRQPLNATPVNSNGTSYTDVIATGLNLTYQWYQGESGDVSQPIDPRTAPSTGPSLSMPVQTSMRVWVRITGQCGVVNSQAAWLSVYPNIYLQPAGSSVSYGSTATVDVGAGGTALHYAWKWANGTPVAGATDSSRLTLSSITANVSVYCEITSALAVRASQAADITLCDGPYITSVPVSSAGGNCRFVTVNVANPYAVSTYLWYQGPRGNTTTPLTQFNGSSQLYVCPTSPTTYWCRVVGYDDNLAVSCYTDAQAVTIP